MDQRLGGWSESQRSRRLSFILWMTLVAAVLLGIDNFIYNNVQSYLFQGGLALACAAALLLNHRRKYHAAGIILSLAVLLTITLSIHNGAGLRDPGIIAFALFIILGTLLFGKKAAPWFAVSAVLAVVFTHIQERRGAIQFDLSLGQIDNMFTIIILLLVSALIIWVIMDNLEQSLRRTQVSEMALRESYRLTLEGWVKALEYRDKETEGHSRRVVEYSVALAHRLGCGEGEISAIRDGALLHDIGKIAIPDAILLKPGLLTPDERAVIQTHPTIARDMLEGIPYLKPALCIPLYHHEQWDGKGYPNGLKGEEIPLAARIFAIVDNWDALSSDRPYRPGWPEDAVKTYLCEEAGRKFDPRLVPEFLSIIESIARSLIP